MPVFVVYVERKYVDTVYIEADDVVAARKDVEIQVGELVEGVLPEDDVYVHPTPVEVVPHDASVLTRKDGWVTEGSRIVDRAEVK